MKALGPSTTAFEISSKPGDAHAASSALPAPGQNSFQPADGIIADAGEDLSEPGRSKDCLDQRVLSAEILSRIRLFDEKS